MTIRHIAFMLAAAVGASAAPTVSNVVTVRKSHSIITIRFDTSTIGSKTRVRYGLTTAYEGAGTFPDSGIQNYNLYDLNTYDRVQLRVTGLRPNTTYHFCPQVSDDNEATWSTCVNHTETTEALPEGPHPAYPIPPLPVSNITPQDTSGCTVRTVASNCSDLQTKINDAAAAQLSGCSVIKIPAGAVCTGSYTLKRAPGSLPFNSSMVNAVTNTITITGHGLVDGDYVKFVGGLPPGSAGFSIFRQLRGLVTGNNYYVKYVNANSFQLSETNGGPAKSFSTGTFTANAATNVLTAPTDYWIPMVGHMVQVTSTGTLPYPLTANTTYYVISRSGANRTFKLSLTSGGAEINITDTGTGTHWLTDPGGDFNRIAKWPPTTNQIEIRTATPDSEFVPPGVRVTPEFASKMPKFLLETPESYAAVSFTNEDLAYNYRIVGVEMTHVDVATSEIATTINPRHFAGWIMLSRAASNIIFDRCYIHGLGQPNRVIRPVVEFNSGDSAIINSYGVNWDYWSPVQEGLTLTRVNNTQFTIAPGTFHISGSGDRSLGSTVTVNLSGAASGAVVGRVYLTMAGVLTLDLPTGVGASCSGGTCNVINSTTPGFPVNGQGGTTVMPIGNLAFTNAAMTNAYMESLYPPNHSRAWEGASGFIANDLQGRTALINNYLSASGLPFHYDDGVGNEGPIPTDYTIERNTFVIPPEQIFSVPGSYKLRYGQRQQLEFKNGKRARIKGNIFEGVHVDATPVAMAIAISATPGQHAGISDIEISSNIFRHGSGTWSVLGGRPKSGNVDTHPPPEPLRRVWVHNNLVYDINQFKYRAYTPNNSGAVALDHRMAIEDIRLEHNTFHDLRGTQANVMVFAVQPLEGLKMTDNLFWINGGSVFGSDECSNNVPSCTGLNGTALMDIFANGYDTGGNSVVVGWTDQTGAAARTSKTHVTSVVPWDTYLMSEIPGNIDWFSTADGNFRIGPLASHKSGGAKRASDGLDRGVDMDVLEREIGVIRLADVLNITSTSVKVPFVAPDRVAACRVAYGTGEAAAWTGRSAVDTTDGFARLINLTGLSPNTEYGYRVWCSGTAQSKTMRFRTAAQ